MTLSEQPKYAVLNKTAILFVTGLILGQLFGVFSGLIVFVLGYFAYKHFKSCYAPNADQPVSAV